MSQAGKQTDTRADRRATFKRAEVYVIGQLVEAGLTPPGPTRTFSDGQSDATIAEAASKKLGRTITASDISRLRHQLIGKLASEGRPSSEAIQNLVRAHDRMARELGEMKVKLFDAISRIEELEDERTDPVPREAIVTPKSQFNGARR